MNIRLRLTLWYSAILFLILVAFSVMVYIGLSRSLFATLDSQLEREAAQVIGAITIRPDRDDDDEDHNSGFAYETRISGMTVGLSYVPEAEVYWRVLDTAGIPVFDPGHLDKASIDFDGSSSNSSRFDYTTLVNNTPLRLYTAPFRLEERGDGIIQIAESYEHIRDIQQQLIFLLSITVPLVLLFASGGGWFLAAKALAPIDRITRAARQISAEDLHQRLNLKLPDDEVGRLAKTFDEMLIRLEDSFQRQKRFIADASHEMRTPLTILKGDVEVALNRRRSIEEYQDTLNLVNQSTDRLTHLVEELFLLARADNNQFPLDLECLNLPDLLEAEVAHFEPVARQKNISLDLDVPQTLWIQADPAKLARLFINLIDNALKYSPPGGTVRVSAALVKGQARVIVADTGPGIPSEHLPHVFDRFYRIDSARTHGESATNGSSGAGLGLSIAQWLVHIHGGRIEVTSEPHQGTIFTIWLPPERHTDPVKPA